MRDRLLEDGYVVVPGVVPRDLCAAVVAAIEQHCGISVADPDTWYGRPEVPPLGFVDDQGRPCPRLFHHQAMWDVRQHRGLYDTFRSLHRTDALWVSMDNVCVKPPAHRDYPEYGRNGFIHFDRFRWSMSRPGAEVDMSKNPDRGYFLAGVIALTDTDSTMGGFQCVPEIYRDLDTWVARQADDWNPRDPDITGYAITPVPMQAGDLCAWTTRLPHGNGDNTSGRLRLAQYVHMFPAPHDFADYQQRRNLRIARCQAEQPNPRLTGLGRRLLGLDEWRR